MPSPNADPDSVQPLTANDLIVINERVAGDQFMIRDIHLLDSALRRPFISLFGQSQFPTLFDKAAALMESLAYHHLFIDGNKRTAVQAVTLFLARNGYQFDYDVARDYDDVLHMAQGEMDVAGIAAWIEARATKLE